MDKTKKFIEKSKVIHGDKYDYSKSEYIKNDNKVIIICTEHGEFLQTPHNHMHLTKPKGCPQCGLINSVNNRTSNINYFIERGNNIHNNKYDYSKSIYINSKTPLTINCPIHGEFYQKPNNHLNGQGCPECGKLLAIEFNKETKSLSTEKFIEKSKIIHGNKYDYSKTNYINYNTKVCITCFVHGEFKQYPGDHYSKGCGCPKCALEVNKSENKLVENLKNKINNIELITQYSPPFLKSKNGQQSIDIYLPTYNIGIEYQGIQHFESVKYWRGENGFKDIVERDNRKYRLCKENNIHLLYFTNEKILDYRYELFNDVDKLIEKIKSTI